MNAISTMESALRDIIGNRVVEIIDVGLLPLHSDICSLYINLKHGGGSKCIYVELMNNAETIDLHILNKHVHITQIEWELGYKASTADDDFLQLFLGNEIRSVELIHGQHIALDKVPVYAVVLRTEQHSMLFFNNGDCGCVVVKGAEEKYEPICTHLLGLFDAQVLKLE